MAVLVVGMLNLDDLAIVGPDGPVARGEGVLGGAAAYAALAVSAFTTVRLVGAAGSDFPRAYLDLLAQRGIDLAGRRRAPQPRVRFSVVYDPQGRVLHLGHQHREAWDFFRPSVPRSWTATPWVLLTGVPPERQVALRRQISPSCHVAVDSLARWIQESPGALRAAAEGAAVLALNHVEAELFTGRADPQAAACALVAVGARWGLVKCGGEGAVLAHHRGMWHVPAYPARFLDGTGAGDTLLGAMIGWLDAHMARHVAVRAAPELDDPSVVLEAVAWGTAAASFTVEGLGPERLLTARRDEMEARVAPIRRGIRPLGPYRV